MCNYCNATIGHFLGCPNMPEYNEEPVAKCDCCGKLIYKGDRGCIPNLLEFNKVCMDCLEDLTEVDEDLEFEEVVFRGEGEESWY